MVWERRSIKLVAGHAAKANDFEHCAVAPRCGAAFLPAYTALWSRAAAAASLAKTGLARAMAEAARMGCCPLPECHVFRFFRFT